MDGLGNEVAEQLHGTDAWPVEDFKVSCNGDRL